MTTRRGGERDAAGADRSLRNRESAIRQLMTAARLGNVADAERIIAADPDVMQHPAAFHATTHAVNYKQIDMLRWLLDHGADINASPYYGKSSAHTDLERPLHWAAGSAPLPMIELLLERGADVEGCLQWFTPLLLATRAGRRDVHDLLLAHGARDHFLVHVAKGAVAEVAAALDGEETLVNQQDKYGTPPLHIAAELQNLAMVNLLLDRGADVNLADAHKETVLFKLGVRLFDEALDHWGPRPPASMHDLSESAQLAVAVRLLEAGADVQARNWRRLTPLHRAVRADRIGYVRWLIDHGADVNAADVAGDTPLRRAVTDVQRLPVAKLLIEAGADVNAKTKRGRSVLSLARHAKMRSLLQGAGAFDVG